MIKRFYIELPLGAEESFDLLRQSGDQIHSWRTNNLDLKNGFIEWKQSFWSLTGTTAILATIEQKKPDRTKIEVIVHKPLQVFDPARICDRVFNKLNKALQNKLDQYLLERQAGDSGDE
ncbi:MAG: hypothetical protein WBW79_07240 [Desulfocapsaceae bacterium]|jgi:hypothetical protein